MSHSDWYTEVTRWMNAQPEWYATEPEALAALEGEHPEWEHHEFTPIRVALWRSNHRFPVARPEPSPDIRWRRPIQKENQA